MLCLEIIHIHIYINTEIYHNEHSFSLKQNIKNYSY